MENTPEYEALYEWRISQTNIHDYAKNQKTEIHHKAATLVEWKNGNTKASKEAMARLDREGVPKGVSRPRKLHTPEEINSALVWYASSMARSHEDVHKYFGYVEAPTFRVWVQRELDTPSGALSEDLLSVLKAKNAAAVRSAKKQERATSVKTPTDDEWAEMNINMGEARRQAQQHLANSAASGENPYSVIAQFVGNQMFLAESQSAAGGSASPYIQASSSQSAQDYVSGHRPSGSKQRGR